LRGGARVVRINFADDWIFTKEDSAAFFRGLVGKPAAIPVDGTFPSLSISGETGLMVDGSLKVIRFDFTVASFKGRVQLIVRVAREYKVEVFMTRLTVFACVVFAALPFVRLGRAAQEQPVGKEQLIYEITVTIPGSRSQGWHGTLYDENGHAMQVEVGKTVMTDIGELKSTAEDPVALWKPYGMVPTTPGMENHPMPDAWSYKLYGKDIGSRCSSWRGELLRGNVVIKPPAGGDQMQTPWGTFIWLSESHGWVHKSWKVDTAKCGIGIRTDPTRTKIAP